MSLIILHRRRLSQEPVYISVATTVSNSASWAFDRFRLYSPTANTLVQIKDHNGLIIDTQPFSSVNSFEHDFTFDLSGNVNKNHWEILITGIPTGSSFRQLYAFPTGFGATRNKNAEISYWDFNKISFVAAGADLGRARFNSQPLIGFDGDIYAQEVNFNNSGLTSALTDKLIISVNNAGLSNGTLNYANNIAPSFASRAAYDALITRGWTITGTAPPTA